MESYDDVQPDLIWVSCERLERLLDKQRANPSLITN